MDKGAWVKCSDCGTFYEYALGCPTCKVKAGDKVKVRMNNGRMRNFTVGRVVQLKEGRPREMNIENGWDGNAYYVDGSRGAHHLCYCDPRTNTLHVVF
jgi:3-dehydroquinate synthase class II